MKTYQKILAIGTLVFGVTVQAQTFNSEESEANIDGLKVTASELNYLSTQEDQNRVGNPATSGNAVFINQIGANNNAVLQTSSNSSEISILQNGAGNDMYSRIAADNIQHSVVQNGDNNLFVHTNPFRMEAHNSQIIQNGNNQNLEWYGGNSISEKMKVTMQGEAESIIIRSFN